MHNRVVFGDRMMSIAREHDLIPDDQYAERESDGQDGAFMKRLVYDSSRLMKIALGIVSEDASNCYDRIAHPFCSLVFQAFGVAIASIIAMLACIQRMKFYLRTAFGESPGFMTALLGTIIQGLCQGNAASPAGWSVVCAAYSLRLTIRVDTGRRSSPQYAVINSILPVSYMWTTWTYSPWMRTWMRSPCLLKHD